MERFLMRFKVPFILLLALSLSISIPYAPSSAQYMGNEVNLMINGFGHGSILTTETVQNGTATLATAVTGGDFTYEWALSPALVSDLRIRGELTASIYISSAIRVEDTFCTLTVYDGATMIAAETDVQDLFAAPTEFSRRLRLVGSATVSDNIRLRAKITLPATLPTILSGYWGPAYPSGLVVGVENPVEVLVESSVNSVEKTVTVSAFITSPFGEYFMNRSATSIDWLGRTDPVTVKERDNDVWVWYFGIDDALEDDYEVTVTATDMQGNSVFSTSSFPIGEPPDKNSWHRDRPFSILSSKIFQKLILYIVICIILLVVFRRLWKRRKKQSKAKKKTK